MRNFLLFIIAVVLAVGLLPIAFVIGLISNIKNLAKYFFAVAIGIDQLGGSVVYAQPDWTISSYSYYLSLKHPKMKYVVKFIDFFFGKDHCKKSFHWELGISERQLNEIKDVKYTQN